MWQTLYVMVYRCLRDRGVSHADAEDLAQETLLTAYRSLDGVEPDKLHAWVRAVARNKHVDLLRRRGDVVVTDAVPDRADSADGPLDAMLAAANREEVQLLLEGLSPEDKQLVELKYVEELSLQEVAARVGRPVNTVKVGLFRARKRLRARIQNERT